MITLREEPWIALARRFLKDEFFIQLQSFFPCGDARQMLYTYRPILRFGVLLLQGKVRMTVDSLPSGARFNDHEDLRSRSRSWLVAQGHDASSIRSEFTYFAGRADLYVPSVPLTVECGGTRVDKVAQTLGAKWSVLFVPYEHGAEVLGYEEGTTFMFEPEPDFDFSPTAAEIAELEACADAVGEALDKELRDPP